MAMIETRALTKHFKDVRAVGGIDLTVARGEFVAPLGPNGAGLLAAVIVGTLGLLIGVRAMRRSA
jgi:ABC-type branched-subunit amino acid transport system ATPase component